MTGVDQEAVQVERAKRVEAEAAQWLQRQQFWNWTQDDEVQFENWRAEAVAHRIAYVRVNEAWKRTQRLTVLRAPMSPRAAEQTSRRPAIFRAVAALVVALAVGTGALLYFLSPREQLIATAIGERRIVTLADGSTIELNTNTSIHVSSKGGSRSIRLDRGEAYFDVRHDDAHPFTVTAGNRRLTDLGTKFLVHSNNGRLDVSVIEGRVLFDTRRGDAGKVALLTTGDELIATDSAITQFKKSRLELTTRLGWRRGVLIFKNTPLIAAVAEFNRYHEKKIGVSDAATGNLKIGGTFATDNVHAFTEVAQDVLGLHVSVRGSKTILAR